MGFDSGIRGGAKIPLPEHVLRSRTREKQGEWPYGEHDVSRYAVAGNEVGGVGIARV